MTASYDRVLGLLRDVRSRPDALGALLNLVRGTRVRVAAELTALADLVEYGALQLDLARLASEDARSAYALLGRMQELRFAAQRLPRELDRVDELLARCRARSVNDVYAVGGTVGDTEAMEFLIAMQLLRRDAFAELQAGHDAFHEAFHVESLLADMLHDEAEHLACLDEWMRWFERRFSARAVTVAQSRLERAFAQVSSTYLAALPDYFARMTSPGERPVGLVAYAVGQ